MNKWNSTPDITIDTADVHNKPNQLIKTNKGIPIKRG